ncbi:MAG: amidohydrolase family protein [Opitutaceae bacterium]|nr:amidohydrolase family protein [Opitutaceae bacterium]
MTRRKQGGPGGGAPAEPRKADLLVQHGVVLTMDGERRVFRDGAVAVAGGVILEVGPAARLQAAYRAARVIDARGGVVQPGFVDSHVHLSHHLDRGMIPDVWPESREHEHWLPYWRALTPRDAYLSALLACLEMLRNGTTTFSDMSGRHAVETRVRAVREVGLRGAVTEICWDLPPHPSVGIGGTRACVRALERIVDAYPRKPGSLVWGAVNFSGMGRATDKLIVAAKALARSRGLTMAMHQSFGRRDVAAFGQRGARSAIAHLHDLGVLGPDLALVHMIHVDAREAELLRRTGTHVIHCPGASVRTGMGASRHGRFPEMLRRGINVALGSDSGNYSDFLDVGRQAYLAATVHREAKGEMPTISAHQALEMATRNGARALGLGDEIGSLEPGKRADLVIHGRGRPEWHPMGDVVNTLVYSAQSVGVDTCIVEGRVVLEGGRSTLVDEEEILARVDRAAHRLYRRMGWTTPSPWPVT